MKNINVKYRLLDIAEVEKKYEGAKQLCMMLASSAGRKKWGKEERRKVGEKSGVKKEKALKRDRERKEDERERREKESRENPKHL